MQNKDSKILVLICEDELYSAMYLKEILIEINSSFEINIVNNLLECIKVINNSQPDLIFLDIELSRNNSFELFEVFDYDKFNIIFISSYEQYAIKAFKVEAIDYVLKPITKTKIENAVVKYKKKITNTNNETKTKILLWNNNKYDSVEISSIMKVKASNQYIIIYFNDGSKIMQSNSLNEFEKNIDNVNFIRIHDSCIININQIKSYIPGVNAKVQLQNDEFEKVSRRKKQFFIDYYKQKK